MTLTRAMYLITPGLFAAAFLSAQPIRIIQPQNGVVISSQQDAQIVAQLDPVYQNPANFNYIEFTVLKTDGTSVFPLGRGDLRSFESPDQARALWRSRAAPGGQYLVRAILQTRTGQLFGDAITITLNRAPSVRVNVLLETPRPGGVEVSFRALVQDAERDAITRVLWTPGDGSPPTEFPTPAIPYIHFYAGQSTGPVSYILSVTAEDARGGESTVQRDVVVTGEDAAVQQTHDCGCTNMDVFSVAGSDSFVYCAPGAAAPPSPGCAAVANPAGVERCPANHTAFRCPIGPFSPGELGANAFGWRFEVNAHISDRTNDFNRCTEGQAARGTITRGGAVIANGATDAVPAAAAALPFPNPPAGALVANPNPYPAAGAANWGADDYTAPRDFKRHSETLNRIRWLDAPRVPRAGAAAITDRRIFVAWVTGNLGTCWCQFEINHEWTAAGGRTGPGGGAAPNRVTRIAGQNCGL